MARTAATMQRLARRIALAALPALLAALVLAPGSLRAAGGTSLAGTVAGLELCPQYVCGAAVFVGRFDGMLDGAAGDGSWWVLVNHEALPLPGESAAITGGRWGMSIGERPLRGGITSGTLKNNGDGTFTVTPRLDLRYGGEGVLSLSILLDHAPFPPTVRGAVVPGMLEAPALTTPAAPPSADE